jgi:hypothetical protein
MLIPLQVGQQGVNGTRLALGAAATKVKHSLLLLLGSAATDSSSSSSSSSSSGSHRATLLVLVALVRGISQAGRKEGRDVPPARLPSRCIAASAACGCCGGWELPRAHDAAAHKGSRSGGGAVARGAPLGDWRAASLLAAKLLDKIFIQLGCLRIVTLRGGRQGGKAQDAVDGMDATCKLC